MSRLGLLLLFSCLHLATAGVAEEEKSVYEVLESFEFPKGILPKDAKGYVLDRESGNFKVFFDKLCRFSLEAGYELRYQKVVTGNIKTGSLQNLRGVSVKLFFVWLDISSVALVDEQLKFYVGLLYQSFPLDNFEECPECGCGLNCVSNSTSFVPLAEY